MHRPTNASVTELPASRDSRGSALMRFQATTRFTANFWGHLLAAKLVPAAHGFNKLRHAPQIRRPCAPLLFYLS